MLTQQLERSPEELERIGSNAGGLLRTERKDGRTDDPRI